MARQQREQDALVAVPEGERARVSKLYAILKKLSTRPDDEAREALREVIRILQPLTGLGTDRQAVKRSGLPAIKRLRDGSYPWHVDLTAAEWSGRQDVDVVALYLQHRAQFERVMVVLNSWSATAEQQQQRRVHPRGRRRQREASESSSGGSGSDSNGSGSDSDGDPSGARFFTLHKQIVERFNESDQTTTDFLVAIRAASNWLNDAATSGPPWPRLTGGQRRTLREMIAELEAGMPGGGSGGGSGSARR